jgi:peptidoglycan-N-acetylglucosamine deacetylase
MLNYRNTLIVFITALILVAATDYFIPVSLGFYIGIVLVLLLLLTWGSISIRAGFYMKSACCGKSSKNAIVLTFDDGPDGLVTPILLDILKEYNAKATFFVIGSKAEKHPEILKRIDNEGHIIGGHSYSHHFFFDLFSYRSMRQELAHTSEIVYRTIGKRIKLFRPPYGVTNPVIAKVIRDQQYHSIGWSLKSKDTVMKNNDQLISRLKQNLKAGDIILFHDSKPRNIKILGTFLKYLDEQHIAVEQIDNFLNIRVYDY